MIEVKKIQNSFTLEERDYQKLRSKGFGEKIGKFFTISLNEVLFLLEKKRIKVIEKGKEVSFESLLKKSGVEEFIVFRDLRSKGYIVRTGLKYGFPFRVYQKGTKIGEEHSLFFVEVLKETSKVKATDISSKIRIANSTKKYVLFAIVDSENSINYIESHWKKI